MSILSLELLDVTAYQALVELRKALTEHPGTTVRVLGEDDTVRHNVVRFLEKEGRSLKVLREQRPWELEIAPGPQPQAHPTNPEPVAVPLTPLATPHLVAGPRPVLLLRSAFAPGDRSLGRRLLLDLLRNLDGVPWVGLAHEALELLEDPLARAVLMDLQARGLRVRISIASLAYLGADPEPFEPLEDAEWQGPAGRGELTLI